MNNNVAAATKYGVITSRRMKRLLDSVLDTIKTAIWETFSLPIELYCAGEEEMPVAAAEHIVLTVTIQQEKLQLVLPKEFLAEFTVELRKEFGICIDQYDTAQLGLIAEYLANQLLVRSTLLRRLQVQVVLLSSETSIPFEGQRAVAICAMVQEKKYLFPLIVGQNLYDRMVQYSRLVSLDDRQKALLAHVSCRFAVVLQLGICRFSTPGTVTPIRYNEHTRIRFNSLGSTRLRDSFGGKLQYGSNPGNFKIVLEKSLDE